MSSLPGASRMDRRSEDFFQNIICVIAQINKKTRPRTITKIVTIQGRVSRGTTLFTSHLIGLY